MIDIVYALGTGSTWDNNELKYSLRSIEKYAQNYRNIYIVGEYPHWLQHAIHIPCDDKYGHERNIMEKIKVACNTQEISDNFLFTNDDHFFLNNIDCETYPFYYKCHLSESIAKRLIDDCYKEALLNTLAVLSYDKYSAKNFDVHTPIVYSKQRFIDIMDAHNWDHEYVIKSLYCNTKKVEGVLMKEDCKITGRIAYWRLLQKIKDRHLFSIGDKCLQPYPQENESSVKVLLNELFPNKSKYEI